MIILYLLELISLLTTLQLQIVLNMKTLVKNKAVDISSPYKHKLWYRTKSKTEARY